MGTITSYQSAKSFGEIATKLDESKDLSAVELCIGARFLGKFIDDNLKQEEVDTEKVERILERIKTQLPSLPILNYNDALFFLRKTMRNLKG